MSASLWVVIVNYRTPDMAIACLRSIADQGAVPPQFRVVVVDNASGDDSVPKLVRAIARQEWQEWATVIASDRNGGFACGNNVGIKEALRCQPDIDYVMLLNPDTIVRPGAIDALLAFMESNTRVGIAGSALENADGGPECSAHHAPSPLGELVAGASLSILSRALRDHDVTPPRRDTAHACDWVSGASLVIRRKVLDDIGLLDDGYFLYFEEVDFCSSARHAGWEVWVVPESRVVHFEGASTGIQDSARRRPRYWYASRRRYFLKHFGLSGLLIADLLWIVGRASLGLRRLLRLGSGGRQRDPKWFAFDLIWGDAQAIFRRAIGDRKAGRIDDGRPA